MNLTHLDRGGSEPRTPRPNIVLIVADDMGYSDIGCFGGEIETPHLDRLGYEGVRFSHAYNADRCGVPPWEDIAPREEERVRRWEQEHGLRVYETELR